MRSSRENNNRRGGDDAGSPNRDRFLYLNGFGEEDDSDGEDAEVDAENNNVDGGDGAAAGAAAAAAAVAANEPNNRAAVAIGIVNANLNIPAAIANIPGRIAHNPGPIAHNPGPAPAARNPPILNHMNNGFRENAFNRLLNEIVNPQLNHVAAGIEEFALNLILHGVFNPILNNIQGGFGDAAVNHLLNGGGNFAMNAGGPFGAFAVNIIPNGVIPNNNNYGDGGGGNGGGGGIAGGGELPVEIVDQPLPVDNNNLHAAGSGGARGGADGGGGDGGGGGGGPALPALVINPNGMVNRPPNLNIAAGGGPLFQEGQYEKCSICLRDMRYDEPYTILPCFHRFHTECLEEWLGDFPLKNLEKKTLLMAFINYRDTPRFYGESFSVMNELRQERQLCDVIIKVEDESFSVHRCVLASISPYFRAMFTNDMAERKMNEITMKEIEPSALGSLIKFAYCGVVRIDRENAGSLLIAASLLLLHRVRSVCIDFLLAQLNPSDVLATRNLAHSMDCDHLVDAANEYVQQNFTEVAMSAEFLDLNLVDLLKIIDSDELEMENEETTYEASIRWIKSDPRRRIPLLPQVLSKVRLALLSPQFLAEKVLGEDLIRSSGLCRVLVDEAMQLQLVPEWGGHFAGSRARHDGWDSGRIYVVGGEGRHYEKLSSVDIYEPVTNTWQMREELSSARSCHIVAVMLRKLYVFGGRKAGETLSAVEVVDYKRRRSSGVAVLRNSIYICGGYDGNDPLNCVDCYRPTTNTWRALAPMRQLRSSCAAAALGGFIYVAGGLGDGPHLDSVEKYDPRRNVWLQTKPMIEKRWSFGLVALRGKLYACGGSNESGCLQSAEVFDPTTDGGADDNGWKLIAPMSCKRCELAMVANMGKLWAIGGFDGRSVLSTVEVYDPNTDNWSFVAQMNVPRRRFAAAVIGD